MPRHLTPLETILLGESKAICTLRARVRAAADVSLPLLLHGPAGSGKELTAWAIHTTSRRPGPFVPFTMSRPTAPVLHDEACTPPLRTVFPADVRDVNGGTAFLDEIAHLPAARQTLLLQALKGTLLHGTENPDGIPTGLRLISATTISPKALLSGGHFQERLLRRLGGVTIAVPSLAERRKDIPVLALYFLSLLPASQRPLGYTAAALNRLKTFDWPENVRELRRVVIAAAKIAPGEMVDEMTIEFARKTTTSGTPPRFTPTPPLADASPSIVSPVDADELFSRSYQSAKQTVTRWLRPTKPTPHYPRLIPPRSSTP